MNEAIVLAILILLPLTLGGIVVAYFGKGSKILEKIKYAFTLHENKGLAGQGLLWFSILCPIFYFITTGIIIWREYTVSITESGLTLFFEISHLPLAVLSSSIPLAVLVSRAHATKQTAKQIEITQQKNNIDLFHSHRKELFSYFSQIGKITYLGCLKAKYEIHPRVHKNFFLGKPEKGTPSINTFSFSSVEQDLRSAEWQIDSVVKNVNPQETYSIYIANLCPTIYRLSLTLGIPEISTDLKEKSPIVTHILDGKATKISTVGTTTKELIAAYRYIKNFYGNLCDFSGRSPYADDDPRFYYITHGNIYDSIGTELVIEEIHKTIINTKNQ